MFVGLISHFVEQNLKTWTQAFICYSVLLYCANANFKVCLTISVFPKYTFSTGDSTSQPILLENTLVVQDPEGLIGVKTKGGHWQRLIGRTRELWKSLTGIRYYMDWRLCSWKAITNLIPNPYMIAFFGNSSGAAILQNYRDVILGAKLLDPIMDKKILKNVCDSTLLGLLHTEKCAKWAITTMSQPMLRSILLDILCSGDILFWHVPRANNMSSGINLRLWKSSWQLEEYYCSKHVPERCNSRVR